MKTVNENDFVDKDTLKTYSEMDCRKVIEDYLLFKGTDGYTDKRRSIALRNLEHMAHITYGLKVNPTNKLYVGMHLEKMYRREGLLSDKGTVTIPDDIFQSVVETHARFKNDD